MATTPLEMAGGEERPGKELSGDDGLEPDAPLYCMSYVSTQSRPMDNDTLISLLGTARENNARRGITGLLLHRGDSFFQVLEGPRDEVKSLFEIISADTRHQRIEIVTEGIVESREYVEWQMAFIEMDGQDLSALPGFSEILKNTPESREFLRTLSRSKKLALLFSVMD